MTSPSISVSTNSSVSSLVFPTNVAAATEILDSSLKPFSSTNPSIRLNLDRSPDRIRSYDSEMEISIHSSHGSFSPSSAMTGSDLTGIRGRITVNKLLTQVWFSPPLPSSDYLARIRISCYPASSVCDIAVNARDLLRLQFKSNVQEASNKRSFVMALQLVDAALSTTPSSSDSSFECFPVVCSCLMNIEVDAGNESYVKMMYLATRTNERGCGLARLLVSHIKYQTALIRDLCTHITDTGTKGWRQRQEQKSHSSNRSTPTHSKSDSDSSADSDSDSESDPDSPSSSARSTSFLVCSLASAVPFWLSLGFELVDRRSSQHQDHSWIDTALLAASVKTREEETQTKKAALEKVNMAMAGHEHEQEKREEKEKEKTNSIESDVEEEEEEEEEEDGEGSEAEVKKQRMELPVCCATVVKELEEMKFEKEIETEMDLILEYEDESHPHTFVQHDNLTVAPPHTGCSSPTSSLPVSSVYPSPTTPSDDSLPSDSTSSNRWKQPIHPSSCDQSKLSASANDSHASQMKLSRARVQAAAYIHSIHLAFEQLSLQPQRRGIRNAQLPSSPTI